MRWKTALLALAAGSALCCGADAVDCTGPNGQPGAAEGLSPAGQGCVAGWLTGTPLGEFKMPSFPLQQLPSNSAEVQGYLQLAQQFMANGGQLPQAGQGQQVPGIGGDNGGGQPAGGLQYEPDPNDMGAGAQGGINFQSDSLSGAGGQDAGGIQVR